MKELDDEIVRLKYSLKKVQLKMTFLKRQNEEFQHVASQAAQVKEESN